MGGASGWGFRPGVAYGNIHLMHDKEMMGCESDSYHDWLSEFYFYLNSRMYTISIFTSSDQNLLSGLTVTFTSVFFCLVLSPDVIKNLLPTSIRYLLAVGSRAREGHRSRTEMGIPLEKTESSAGETEWEDEEDNSDQTERQRPNELWIHIS